MDFNDKIKSKIFWTSFLKITTIFIVLMTIGSILLHNFSDVFSGNWQKIKDDNFSGEKWRLFFGYKIIFSILYGLWTVNKKIK